MVAGFEGDRPFSFAGMLEWATMVGFFGFEMGVLFLRFHFVGRRYTKNAKTTISALNFELFLRCRT